MNKMNRKLIVGLVIAILATLLPSCGGEEVEEVDVTPPVISQVSVSEITETTAIITWATDEPADSVVYYVRRIHPPAHLYVSDENLVTSHSISLSELATGATYNYWVRSKDASGNEVESEVMSFTTLEPDTTAPVISDVRVIDIGETRATITWITDEPATSQVAYHTSSVGCGLLTFPSPDLTTEHSFGLKNLKGNTTYDFRVVSQDAAGNEAVSSDYSFTTQDLTAPGESPT